MHFLWLLNSDFGSRSFITRCFPACCRVAQSLWEEAGMGLGHKCSSVIWVLITVEFMEFSLNLYCCQNATRQWIYKAFLHHVWPAVGLSGSSDLAFLSECINMVAFVKYSWGFSWFSASGQRNWPSFSKRLLLFWSLGQPSSPCVEIFQHKPESKIMIIPLNSLTEFWES